ncbi:porin [Macromonas bipunctata]|uniref:porin n=1 Tax=Macromonas bipunctata TaxID=183670 RepID=UPI000C334435|nr:porin [Macromonas bipunctata]
MKKTLIALAAVAATTGAFAQSSVAIYGIVDAGISNAIGGATDAQTGINEAAASRLGFRGTEDLGGGLKAVFRLEHRFKPDTGAQSHPTAFWHGNSTVGLSSAALGTVEFGRAFPAAYYTAGGADVFSYDGIASNHLTTTAGLSIGTSSSANAVLPSNATGAKATDPNHFGVGRFENGIFYTSPNWSGFSARVSVSAEESGAAGAKAPVSAQLNYTTGPFSVSVAGLRTQADDSFAIADFAYNFGFLRANLAVSTSEVDANGRDSSATVLGLTAPMGPWTFKASYAQLKQERINAAKVVVGGKTTTISQLGLGARYALSKRTDLYTSFARDSKKTAGDADKTGYEFGVKHMF